MDVRLALLWLVSVAGVAHADAVGPPPMTCPTGGSPNTCHVLDGHCAVAACTSDAQCMPGRRCVTIPICIRTESCGGLGGPVPVETVTGTCPGSCPSGSSCVSRAVCATSAPPDASGDGGGGVILRYGCCAVAGSRGTALDWLAALLVLGIFALRRSSRKGER